MNLLKRILFWTQTGANVGIANDGKPLEEVVIRYKNLFFVVDIDVASGEPTGDFGWSKTPMTHTPIRDFWTARPPKSKPSGKSKK